MITLSFPLQYEKQQYIVKRRKIDYILLKNLCRYFLFFYFNFSIFFNMFPRKVDDLGALSKSNYSIVGNKSQ